MRRNRGQRGYRFKQAEAKAQARQAIRSKPHKLTAPIRRKTANVVNVAIAREMVGFIWSIACTVQSTLKTA